MRSEAKFTPVNRAVQGLEFARLAGVNSNDETPGPPQAPELTNGSRVHGRQLLGLAALLAIPLLALLGVFGTAQERATARNATLELTVSWPSRTRLEMIHSMDVTVRNLSSQRIDTLRVELPHSYMSGFSARDVVPSPVEPWIVEITDVPPGEQRLVTVGIDASSHGRFAGDVTATALTPDTVRVPIATRVLP